MREHDPLCLTRSGEEPCNCAAIAECKAATHHPLCPAREPDEACRHCHEYPVGCECVLLRQEEAVSREFFHAEGYASGQRDALAAAIERVEALRPDTDPDIAHVIVSDVIDAITGEQ